MSGFPEPKKIILLHEAQRKKYVGNVDNIIVRSSWEHDVLLFLLNHPSIISLNMEECVIQYFSPVDNRYHRYFMDFWVKLKTKSGVEKQVIIEVKPWVQTQIPKMTYTKTGKESAKRKASYNKQLNTYMVNLAKWKAAKEFALLNRIEFMILTDDPKVNFKYDKKYIIWKPEMLGLDLDGE